jgi:hypothetical protein
MRRKFSGTIRRRGAQHGAIKKSTILHIFLLFIQFNTCKVKSRPAPRATFTFLATLMNELIPKLWGCYTSLSSCSVIPSLRNEMNENKLISS